MTIKVLSALLTLVVLNGCISTKVKDFTDPDYRTHVVKDILIVTPSDEFDEILIESFEDEGINAKVTRYGNVFLPTRRYGGEEIRNTLLEKGFDSIIYIQIAGEDSGSNIVGFMTNSNAQAYSSGYGYNVSGSSYSMPIVSHRRDTTSKAQLFDVKNQRTVWVADLHTKAKGGFYVQDDDTMESISEEVVESLMSKGHLIRK